MQIAGKTSTLFNAAPHSDGRKTDRRLISSYIRHNVHVCCTNGHVHGQNASVVLYAVPRTSSLHTSVQHGSGAARRNSYCTAGASPSQGVIRELGGAVVQVARWCNGKAFGLAISRSQVQILPKQRCVTTLGKLFTPMCLCHQAV